MDCNHKGQLLGLMGYQGLSHKTVSDIIIQALFSSVTNLARALRLSLKKELFHTSDEDDAHLSIAAENGPCRDG